MSKRLLLLVAALLLLPACGNCKRTCANRYCPPTAPTRPICPEAKPRCGCQKKTAPRCGQQPRPCSHKKTITLNNMMDYLPGLPPGHLGV